MRLGIVGHEAAKFDEESEFDARAIIRGLIMLDNQDVTEVVSGACHLGGIDIWSVEEAKALGVPVVEYAPKSQTWTTGYKPRNTQIAERADKVVSIVVKKLPKGYKGMVFPICYHCKTDSHVKSGGCWTARLAGRLGKPFEIIEVNNE